MNDTMTEDIMNESGLAGLPSEVLSEIIRSLLDEITTNKRSGRPHDYSTRDYRRATARATKALVTLCLVSRRLREAATISLYRHVTLVPRRLPDSPIASEAPPHDSVVPLTLFLRTLVERPDLQPLVQSLDCQFFLRHAESTPASVNNPESAPRYQKAFEFHKHIIESTKRSPLSQEDLILKHIATPNHGRVNDTSERALAAILCLTPELRAISLAPLPASKWLIITFNDAEFFAAQDQYHYHTLVSLVESARQSEVCPGALQHLQAVRFTALFGFKAFGGLEDVQHSEVEDDPTRRHCAGYTFPLCSCLKLLLGPNITEFEADAVDKYHPGNFRDPKVPIHCSIKRAYFTISAPLRVLNHVGHAWDLSALSVRPSLVPLFAEEGGFNQVAELDLWDKSFLNIKNSLKELDIGHVEGYEKPSHRLSSLPLLEALEHLCIGIPLLADKFSESPLNSLLPPNLKTLRLHDWFTVKYYDKYHPSLDHLEMTEDDVEDGLKPLVKFQIEFSTALRSFSQICGNTHPHLRSLQIFGFLPMEKVSFDLAMSKDEKTKDDYFQALREVDLDGPEPGQVVRGGMEIRGLFAQAGVDFEELLHTQEFHYPFRAQVSRYQ